MNTVALPCITKPQPHQEDNTPKQYEVDLYSYVRMNYSIPTNGSFTDRIEFLCRECMLSQDYMRTAL